MHSYLTVMSDGCRLAGTCIIVTVFLCLVRFQLDRFQCSIKLHQRGDSGQQYLHTIHPIVPQTMIADTMKIDPSSNQLEGCVVSEHTTATDIGISMFAQGGNAIDAVVATILAVGTLCPYHSDIGGSGFALVRTPDGEHHALSFRGCAPVSQSYSVQVVG
jgi:hypothetical protein